MAYAKEPVAAATFRVCWLVFCIVKMAYATA
jgi:hypothetical protein